MNPPEITVRATQAEDLAPLSAWLGRAPEPPKAAHEHLLVAERGGEPLAALRIVPHIGLDLPRVSYHVGCVVHAAPELDLFHRQRTLLLGHDHTGASELADIAWKPALTAEEQATTLQALVQAALDHIGRHRKHYAESLIVELPGPRQADGRSAFWHGLGRHFYPGDITAASSRHGKAWRSHVAHLLPKQTIYTSFLSADAQAAIGQVHPSAHTLARVLSNAGWHDSAHINVEDGGPIFAR
jgi:arginine N-succinyltransferase